MIDTGEQFVHHKSDMDSLGTECGFPAREAGDIP